MKRKRSSSQPHRHSNTFSPTKRVTRSTKFSHKESSLLQLPPELRLRILQHLLYSAEPLGSKGGDCVPQSCVLTYSFDQNFTLYPAVLRVCRQIYDEGKDILYRQNTAKAIMSSRDQFLGSPPNIRCLHILSPWGSRELELTRHFIKWEVTVMVYQACPRNARAMVAEFISKILWEIPKLHELKVRLRWYNECCGIRIANHQDFDDMAEQLFRPFSTLRVRKAEFVDQNDRPIRTILSLSRLMMSDTPPAHTLHDLLNDLNFFLDYSLTEPSRTVVKSRTPLLVVARDEYDVEAFRFALRQFLAYLRYYRGLEPPRHLLEFAQDSVSAATNTGRITDCPKDVLGIP